VALPVEAIGDDRENRKAEMKRRNERRAARSSRRSSSFTRTWLNCNIVNIEGRKEIIKYGGKVAMMPLVAVAGIKVATAAMGIPFP
jgi:hypothetical protein